LKILKNLTIAEVASIVSSALEEAGITAVLSGGSVVSIYSDNEYESQDLDFISPAEKDKLAEVMDQIGFKKQSKYFAHPDTDYFVEFPASPLMIGHEYIPYQDCAVLQVGDGKISILTPTQCVMDRLAGFYHWFDRQSLDQALMVARRHIIDLRKVKSWSKKEGHSQKYDEFLENLKYLQN
jgi:hypothetical protein